MQGRYGGPGKLEARDERSSRGSYSVQDLLEAGVEQEGCRERIWLMLTRSAGVEH